MYLIFEPKINDARIGSLMIKKKKKFPRPYRVIELSELDSTEKDRQTQSGFCLLLLYWYIIKKLFFSPLAQQVNIPVHYIKLNILGENQTFTTIQVFFLRHFPSIAMVNLEFTADTAQLTSVWTVRGPHRAPTVAAHCSRPSHWHSPHISAGHRAKQSNTRSVRDRHQLHTLDTHKKGPEVFGVLQCK